jgi:hypothetical protein
MGSAVFSQDKTGGLISQNIKAGHTTGSYPAAAALVQVAIRGFSLMRGGENVDIQYV